MDEDAALSPDALSRAFRQAYEDAGYTQTTLADATGIDQSLISKYARGAVTPPLHVLPKIDAACRRPRGHVLRLAGLVEDDTEARTALAADPKLTPEQRAALLQSYDGFVRLNALNPGASNR